MKPLLVLICVLILTTQATAAKRVQLPPSASATPGAAPIDLANLRIKPLVRQNAAAARRAPRQPVSADARIAALTARLKATAAQTLNDATRADTRRLTQRQHATVARLREELGAAVSVRMRTTTGTPAELRLPRRDYVRQYAELDAGQDLAIARGFLKRNSELFRLDDPTSELTFVSRTSDRSRRQLRFSQALNGVPVWPGELLVQLDGAGDVERVSGWTHPTPSHIDTTPLLGLASARSAVTEALPLRLVDAEVSTPELIVFAPGDAPARLAWRAQVNAGLTHRWEVVVDAASGASLAAFNKVAHTDTVGSGTDLFGISRPLRVFNDNGSFLMVNTSKQMFLPSSNPPEPNETTGAIYVLDIRNESEGDSTLFHVTSNTPNAWPLADAVSASYSLSETYDYFLERHGRDSLDGQGGSMLSIIRFDDNFDNAFWNGQFMVFGDGGPYAGALDIVAHELAHGVTENSAGLVYRNQSGALNEAFSDIFGEGTEARTNGAPDWVTGAALGTPLRNLANPGALTVGGRPYPSNMTEFIQPNDPFLDRFTNRDNGGVHINSSIINHTFYLLAEGLPGAIGIQDAERIFYRTLTTKLVPNSQFFDARIGAIASAEELFGVNSAQALKTAEAFDATQIFDGAPPPTEAPSFPGTDGEDAVLFAFFDNSIGGFVLGRREEARGDGPLGVRLTTDPVVVTPPGISGDGILAAFVDIENDVCLIATGGGAPSCIGFPGLVGSVGVAPNGTVFGFVFLDEFTGEPQPQINVIDISNDTFRRYDIQTPALDADTNVGTVDFADAMDFTADGRFIIYDAFNSFDFSGNAVGSWSIYAIDLATEAVFTLIEPTPDVDYGFPSISQTSDSFIVFDAFDRTTGRSTVVAANLTTGDTSAIASVRGFSAPGYSGDDTAIVFSRDDDTVPTEFSLVRQPVADDRLTTVGAEESFLADADVARIYRRGTFVPPSVPLVSALLPLSRSVQVGDTATAFASIINSGNTLATECNILPLTGFSGNFFFQTTDPATNAVIGSPNNPVDIAAGALQTFLISITPDSPVSPTSLELSYSCTNTDPANVIAGINTLQFSADNQPVPDVVALAATTTNDGVVALTGVNETGFFAVSTVNVGATANIDVSADTGGQSVPVAVLVCETNPVTGECLQPPAASVNITIGAGGVPTFAVFITASSAIGFDPAVNRVFLRFRQGSIIRGATSVAVRTP